MNLHRHCTGGSGHGETSEAESGPGSSACQPRRRDYDVGLRVGLLFVILATGALGVFGPILLHKMMPSKLNVVLIVLKQFGTGIIISTAFVHVCKVLEIMSSLLTDVISSIPTLSLCSATNALVIWATRLPRRLSPWLVSSCLSSSSTSETALFSQRQGHRLISPWPRKRTHGYLPKSSAFLLWKLVFCSTLFVS